MRTLHVKTLGGEYPIVIGRNILEATLPKAVLRSGGEMVVVITNTTLETLHLQRLLLALQNIPLRVEWLSVPDGEQHKTLTQLERIHDHLMKLQANRRTTLVAFGGGVVGDITGLTAATYMRGIPYIQVPTTLLSFVDSSIGGKTAVNHPRGKNSIGAFKQPNSVVTELEFLNTLPKRELRAGLFELIKHGIIRDLDLFDFIACQEGDVFDAQAAFWEEAVTRSCMVKRDLVQKDEREQGVRSLLNFGHSLAHLLETHTEYRGCLHGEAVGIGMMFAAFASHKKWGLSKTDWKKMKQILTPWLMPIDTPPLSREQFADLLSHDKKNTAKGLNFIALTHLGQAVARPTTQIIDLWPCFQDFVQQHPQLLPGIANHSPNNPSPLPPVGVARMPFPQSASLSPAVLAGNTTATALPNKFPTTHTKQGLSTNNALIFLNHLALYWKDFAKAWDTLLPFAQQAAAKSKNVLQTRIHHALVKQLPAWFGLPSGPGAHYREWGTLHALEDMLNPGYFSAESVEKTLPNTLQGGTRQKATEILCDWLRLRDQGIPKAFPFSSLQAEEVLDWVLLMPRETWDEHWVEHLNALEACGFAGPSSASIQAWMRFEAGSFNSPPNAVQLQAWQEATWHFNAPSKTFETPSLAAVEPTDSSKNISTLTHASATQADGYFIATQTAPTTFAHPNPGATASNPEIPSQTLPTAVLSAMANLVSAAFAGRFSVLDIEGPCSELPVCKRCPFGLAQQQQNINPLCAWADKNTKTTRHQSDFSATEAQAWLGQQSNFTNLPDSLLLQVAFNLSAQEKERLEQAMFHDDLSSIAQLPPESIANWAHKHGLPAEALQAFFTLLIRLKSKSLRPGSKMSTAQDVFDHCGPHMSSLKQERLLLIMLDANKCFLGERLISQGLIDGVFFHPRDVFSPAILQGAHSVILVHNHPSGNPTPSQADITLTKSLYKASILLQIPLIDHIVIGGDTYVSMLETQWVADNSNFGVE